MMNDAGFSEGGGGSDKAPPREDKTVELRKSCDYCVRLKRACDGKNPCSLCLRRHKHCTRSARKKSGPAKGTKYAPRRKRSPIAEWAARAAVGAREPHPFDSVEGKSVEPIRACSGGNLPLMATVGSFLRPWASERPMVDAWGDPAGLSNSQARRAELGMPSSSPMLPFPVERFVKTEGEQQRERRRLAPRLVSVLNPPPATWSTPSTINMATVQQTRPGLQLALASPDGSEKQEDKWRPPLASSIAPLSLPSRSMAPTDSRQERVWESHSGGSEAHGERERRASMDAGVVGPMLTRPMGIDLSRGRMWERPGGERTDQWDTFDRHHALVYAKRPRLSVPFFLSTDESTPSSSHGSGREDDPIAASSDRLLGGGAGSSSTAFRPSAREPSDPTAGFTFRPSTQPLSWRRPPSHPPQESRDIPVEIPQLCPRPASSYADNSTSWDQTTGEAAAGRSGDGMIDGFSYPSVEARRRTEASEGAKWRLPSSESGLHTSHDDPSLLFGFNRPRPRERPLAGRVVGGYGVRDTELQEPSPPAAGPGRRRMFPLVGATGQFERHLEISPGRQPAGPVDLEGKSAGGGGRGSWAERERQRLEIGRQGDPQGHPDWERFFPRPGIVSTPTVPSAADTIVRGPAGGSTRGTDASSRKEGPDKMLPLPEFEEETRRSSGRECGLQPQWFGGGEPAEKRERGSTNPLGHVSQDKSYGKAGVSAENPSFFEGGGQHEGAKAASSSSASEIVNLSGRGTRVSSPPSIADSHKGEGEGARSSSPRSQNLGSVNYARVRESPRGDLGERTQQEVWRPPSRGFQSSREGEEESDDKGPHHGTLPGRKDLQPRE